MAVADEADREPDRGRARDGGRLLVDCLRALGATRAFGVPGESYLAVLDALHDARGALDFVNCRHEGGAAFMAAAWGKLTGTPGICLVTRGPGATNASIGVHTARQDSSPMLLFVGQVDTRMRGREAFQELDYRAVFGTLAKWAVEIEHVDRIPEIVSRAWTVALSGRPGPVVVALPEDVLAATTDAPPLAGPVDLREAAPDGATLDAVLGILDAAERPLLLVGGAGWRAGGRRALAALADRLRVPTIVSSRRHDLVDNDSDVYAGDAGVGMGAHVRELLAGGDAILAINARLGEMTTDAWTLPASPPSLGAGRALVHAHASAGELGRAFAPTLAVHAGPNAFSIALAARVAGQGARRVDAPWRERARLRWLDSLDAPAQPGPVDMARVMVRLRARLPRDAILTNGAGNFAIWPNRHFAFGADHRLLAPQSGAMGYGLPAAIAAKLRHPGRTVVCFAGDGDLQMVLAELGTAMQTGAAPVVLVLDNGAYGTIRMHQERRYPDRVSGTELQNPDFAAIARAYGFHAERVEATDAFDAALERALESTTGALLVLATSIEALTPGVTLSELRSST